jgi:hypothetical protein
MCEHMAQNEAGDDEAMDGIEVGTPPIPEPGHFVRGIHALRMKKCWSRFRNC